MQPPTQRKPVGALQLLLKSGRTVIIRILERGANTVIARDDQQFEYLLSAPVAARLLAPPGKPAAAAPALSWLRENHHEDPHLSALADALAARGAR